MFLGLFIVLAGDGALRMALQAATAAVYVVTTDEPARKGPATAVGAFFVFASINFFAYFCVC